MKKTLLTLGITGLALVGLSTASAQYYEYNASSMHASAYTYAEPYYTSHSYGYHGHYGTGGTGSYTIGCTTYYYNTRTGTVTNTQNICNTYVQPTHGYNNTYYSYPSTSYTYPSTQYSYSNYTYPSTSQYCTYGYSNGSWQPCTSNSLLFGNSGYNNYNYPSTGYTNPGYGNCYYTQYGSQVCY